MTSTPGPEVKERLTAIYHALLDAWNRRSAADYAALFDPQALVVGFDGSVMDGSAAVRDELGRIFADHETARYVGKIRSMGQFSPDGVLIHAVCGMVPPGMQDINPAVNAVQTLVAIRGADEWRILLFQNTPAQFHGRPELSTALTEELRQLL